MSAVFRAEDVTYRVRDGTLVDAVSLDLAVGTITVIVGPNGAGKSTLLRLVSGELQPSAGRVLCDGKPLATLSSRQLACRRAVMTQASRLSFPFTVHEVVRLGLDGIGAGMTRADRPRVVAECLAAAGGLELAPRLFQTLSGGEQRRVQFARVLAQLEAGRALGPAQALLLDEPIASLDLHHQLALMDMARTIAARGTAVLAIVHDLNIAARYADTLVVMSEGAVVARGGPPAVLRDELISRVFGVDLAAACACAGRLPLIVPRRWLA